MTDTTTCQNCGAIVPASASFCTTCGTKVESDAWTGSPTSESTGADLADASPLSAPTDASGNDATRIDDLALHERTRVLPETPPAPAQGAEPPSWVAPAPGPDPQAWAAQTPAPPQQPSWQPPPTAAPQPSSWQPPPSSQPDWAQQQAQPWASPGAPTAPPSQWQQPAPSWQTNTVPPVPAERASRAGLAALLAFLGAILLVISVFTPWIGIKGRGQSSTYSGWQMVTDKKKVDGFQTPDPAILLGIAAVVFAVGALLIAGKNKGLMRILLILAAIGSAAVVVRDWLSIRATVKKVLTSDFKLTFQFGFWLAAAAAVILLVAALTPSKKRT